MLHEAPMPMERNTGSEEHAQPLSLEPKNDYSNEVVQVAGHMETPRCWSIRKSLQHL